MTRIDLGISMMSRRVPGLSGALASPVLVADPVVTHTAGTSNLSVTNGSWTGNPAPTFAYQWRRNGVDVAGATASTYTIPDNDSGTLWTCRVIATNSQGSANVTPVSVFVGSLSRIPAAGGYFALRRVSAGYTGPAIRVRRSSDNLQTDIGFTANGALDTTALLTHVGVGSGFVTKWYDQSGNGRDFTQATAANQPEIVNAGVVRTLGDVPALFFGGSAWLSRTGLTIDTDAVTPYSINTVFQASNAGAALWLQTGTNWAWDAPGRFILYLSGTTQNSSGWQFGSVQWAGGWTAGNVALTSGANNVCTYTAPASVGAPVLFTNGVQNTLVLSPARADGTPTEEHIGRAGPPGANGVALIGLMTELSLFQVQLSAAARNTLERNQGAYYGIAVA